MKSFKEYLQEQKQIEEGVLGAVGHFLDKGIVGLSKLGWRGTKAVGRGLRDANWKKIGKVAAFPVVAPFKVAGMAAGALVGGLSSSHHDHKGLKSSEKEEERKEGAAKERRDRQIQDEADRQAEEIEMKKHGFHPGKVGRREAYRHWKVTHANLASHNPGHKDHERAMISGTKFHPQSQSPGTIP